MSEEDPEVKVMGALITKAHAKIYWILKKLWLLENEQLGRDPTAEEIQKMYEEL